MENYICTFVDETGKKYKLLLGVHENAMKAFGSAIEASKLIGRHVTLINSKKVTIEPYVYKPRVNKRINSQN